MLYAHAILALLWIGFGMLHSLLAGPDIKERFASSFPKQAKYYRLLYTLFAFITFGLVLWYQVQLPSPFVFQRNLITNSLGAVAALAGASIMVICIKKYFLSLSGLKSLFQERPRNKLMINGIHRYVRHPLYAGTFLAIWGAFLLYPLLSLFVANIIITAYTLIGISFEERKLLAEFGDAYTTYQKTVPKLIPAFGRKSI